ncbi:MAG: phosphodiester glycosidase family protein [Candidatus Wallbacteria bacterium]|nr:phosphodiester glycosidase family protein [Candidatus Wallbacteria bacterium]
MRFLLNLMASVCLAMLGCFFFVAMEGFAVPHRDPRQAPLPPALTLTLSGLAATATPALALAPPAALPTPPLSTPPAAEVAANLRRVHVAHAVSSLALMLDFSSTVDFQTEYEPQAHRFGFRVSPVDRSSLAERLRELSTAFGPTEIRTESSMTHEVWLTLADGVAPSAQSRTAAGQQRTLLFDFEVAGHDRSAEVVLPVTLGHLSAGRKAERGRGYNFYQYRWTARDGAGSPVFAHRVDPASGDFEVALALAKDRIHARLTLSDIAAAHAAVGGVNAGFFAIHGNGDPLGLLVSSGRLLSAPIFSRAAVGIFPGGRVLLGNPELSGRIQARGAEMAIDGLNQAREAGKLLLYTHDYGASTLTRGQGFEASVAGGKVLATGECDLPIPPEGFVLSKEGPLPAALAGLRPGDEVSYQYGLTPPWNSSLVAVGGGPRLVVGGKVVAGYESEHFTRQFALERAPRTGVGLTASGKLLLVAVDGRHPPDASGATLPELAEILLSLGAADALNMDGGGSTTCWVTGQVINSPSDRHERPICSALLVVPRSSTQHMASAKDGDDRG